MNLGAAHERLAHARGDVEAIVDGARRITHRELAADIARTAAHLHAHGIAAGHTVGVALGDHAGHLTIMLALARLGAVLLPLDHRWTAAEQTRVAAHFGADAVLVEPGGALPGQRTIAVDDRWHAAVAAAPPAAPLAAGDDLPLLISLSSGTTGRPKGPRITHDHFLARFRTHWVNLGFVPDDRFVCATPLYFGAGRTFAWSTLYLGGTVILDPPPFEPARLVETIARERATTLFLVPTQLRRLLAEVPGHPALAGLRLLLSSGAPLTAAERLAIRDRLNARFCEYYASTEGGGVSLLTPADLPAHAGTVGRAVHGVEIEIVDAAHRTLPPDTVGRLRYRSPGCATAFHRDPDASAEAFRDGWFYPGDLARLDADGYLTLAGRAKDMIIRGGVNIYPDEIEAVLRAHPALADVAVAGVASPDLGEEIAAYVVLRAPVDDAALADWCAARLAPYKVPRAWHRLDALPRNASGKVVKAALAGAVPGG
ncbi:MAG: AMP-binding protein [Burkholderiales bacterium]|nr:AMP-binding protein [Burkholderiales bacterium]